MLFAGIQKLTLLDYPQHVACTLFTQGCGYRCPFCHEQLGRTDPQRCPRCGAWISEGPEPGPEKKKIQHKKKKH